MADKPIIFSGAMVRAILDGRKSQTRRVLKNRNGIDLGIAPTVRTDHPKLIAFDHPKGGPLTCVPWPYAPGDRLWVREAHWFVHGIENGAKTICVMYRADGEDSGCGFAPSIHMPRWASRLTLTVTDVRVQRLQEISEEDARAEGAHERSRIGDDPMHPTWTMTGEGWRYETPREAFAALWQELHGSGAWDANPWVVAITFSVEKRNIDAKVAA